MDGKVTHSEPRHPGVSACWMQSPHRQAMARTLKLDRRWPESPQSKGHPSVSQSRTRWSHRQPCSGLSPDTAEH